MLWSPIVGNDLRPAAEKATALLQGTRAQHFWDLWSFGSRSYAAQFKFPKGRAAWDLFIVYKPGLEWKSSPPPPTLWLQNLGMNIGTKYTPELLEAELKKWIQ